MIKKYFLFLKKKNFKERKSFEQKHFFFIFIFSVHLPTMEVVIYLTEIILLLQYFLFITFQGARIYFFGKYLQNN